MKKNSKIDLMKIGKIKTKGDIDEYDINKPLLNGNYLFHYLILTDNLTGLKLSTHPIYIYNIDGLNGMMLAAREKKYDILDYLIKTYKSYLYLTNKKNMTFLHYMEPNDEEYIDIIKKNSECDWTKLFQQYSSSIINPIDILFLKGSYNTIKDIINLVSLNYKSYMTQPYHFNLLMNNNLKSEMIINIFNLLEKKDKNILTYVDEMGHNISFPIVASSNEDLLKYMIDKFGNKLDIYSPYTGNHIFVMAYKLGINNNNYKLANIILPILDKHNYLETDTKGNNLIHFILKSRLETNKGDYNIESTLLKNYKEWDKPNMDKKTPFDYIVQLDYKKYHKFISNKFSEKSHTNKKWQKYLTNLPTVNNNDNDIKLIETPYAHSNMFQSRFTDIGIFCIYLKEKYKDLYLPQYNGKDIMPNWNDDMILPDDLLKTYNNFPWLIIWNNEKNYWIHPKLNKLMKKNMKKYKCGFVILSMRLPNMGLHAALIFYDFTRNVIERYDPYGDTEIMDGMMDEILKQHLTRGLNMKYCSPGCYFPIAGFQTISDENNIMNQKMGDFGGYCLAWCIWYVEHRIININIEPYMLIKKTINKFMKMNIKPMEYIRNYANHISKFRIAYLKNIGIPEQITTNEIINNNYKNIIYKSIIKYNQ